MLANYDAVAYINGGSDYPDIMGVVGFKSASDGTWIDVDIKNLPEFKEGDEDTPQIGPHGFHIHEKACGGYDFSQAGGHWNKNSNPHGNHTGDLPALFSNGGRAKMLVFTDKFKPSEAIGKSVVIHLSPDDYKTEPSGNTGVRIACGTIEKAE